MFTYLKGKQIQKVCKREVKVHTQEVVQVDRREQVQVRKQELQQVLRGGR